MSDFTSLLSSTNKNTTNDSFMKYHIFLIITVLPSLLAVIIPPPDLHGSLHGSLHYDWAIVITHSLLVAMVYWLAKTCCEWPWNWLLQVRETKEKLLNYTNSSKIIDGNRSLDLVSNLVYLKAIIRYERFGLVLCFLGILVTCGIMVGARNVIIVDESRRDLVFSNLNIVLFAVWISFRLIILTFDCTQCLSASNEYGLINDTNVDMCLEKATEPSGNISFFEKYLHVQFTALFHDSQDIKSDQIQNRLNIHEKILSTSLQNQMTKIDAINDGVKKLEVSIKDVPKIQSSVPLTPPSPPSPVPCSSPLPNTTYVKPFPLNLSTDVTQSTLKSSVGQKLTTIFEEKESEITPQTNIKLKFVPNKPINPIPEPVFPYQKKQKGSFSLHGLPSSSWSNSFTTGNKGNLFSDYNDTKSVHSNWSIPSSETNKLSLRAIFHRLRTKVSRIRRNYPVALLLKHPLVIQTLFNEEIYPYILKLDNIKSVIELVIWQFIWHYGFDVMKIVFNPMLTLLTQSITTLETIIIFYFNITVRLPYNFVTMVLSIVFFIPRSIFQMVFVSPLLGKSRPSSSESIFEGVRSFNLHPKFHPIPQDYRTKGHIIKKLNQKIK